MDNDQELHRLVVRILVCLVALVMLPSEVPGQPLIQSDVNGLHSPETQVTPNRGVGGERWRNSLVPAAPVGIGPGATPAELASLAAAFPPPAGGNAGWVFVNGGGLPGDLTVVHYDAFEELPESPVDAEPGSLCVLGPDGPFDCFQVRYDNLAIGPGQTNPVAPHVLRWIQLVCTNSPTGGAPACPPAYVDPQPADDNLPFYYTEPQHFLFSALLENPPLFFLDRPRRNFPLNRVDVNWQAHLYLVEWNGVAPNRAAPGPNGVVTIHGGLEWGFHLGCLAIGLAPSTYRRGGVDRDKPTTETSGAEPSGLPSLACREKPPTCKLTGTGTDPEGNSFVEVTAQDRESGLASISILRQENATLTGYQGFPAGTRDPVVVRATKQESTEAARFELRVADVAGNAVTCDPVITAVVRGNGKPVSESYAHLPQEEKALTISNGRPGLQTLHILVNGQNLPAVHLADGEARTLDLSAIMLPGDTNIVVLKATGKPGGQAVILLSDGR